MFLIFLFGFLNVGARAQEVTVWAKDPMSVRPLYKGNKHVKIDDAAMAAKDNADDGYLTPDKRDAVFARTGFTAIVAKMDDADKDLLVMSAHTSELKDLKVFYPKIKSDDLLRLKVAVDAEVGK